MGPPLYHRAGHLHGHHCTQQCEQPPWGTHSWLATSQVQPAADCARWEGWLRGFSGLISLFHGQVGSVERCQSTSRHGTRCCFAQPLSNPLHGCCTPSASISHAAQTDRSYHCRRAAMRRKTYSFYVQGGASTDDSGGDPSRATREDHPVQTLSLRKTAEHCTQPAAVLTACVFRVEALANVVEQSVRRRQLSLMQNCQPGCSPDNLSAKEDRNLTSSTPHCLQTSSGSRHP